MPSRAPNGVDEKLFAVCEEFMRFCYDVFGAYLDALAGLDQIREDLVNRQKAKIAELKNAQPEKASEEFMDQQALNHRFQADQHGPEELLHRSTQGDFKRRTAPGGLDARLLSQMLLALLYGAWEDRYREKVALCLGYSHKNALGSDLFQDINKLRQAILHNQGKATEDVEHAKIICWFRRGDEIYLSRERARQLLAHIDHYVTQLCGIQSNEKQLG
jgi:hypothetical protein